MSEPNLFGKRRVAAKLHYSMINQFMLYWIKWNRPCDLSVRRSEKSPETLGICFDVDNTDTADMMQDLVNNLKIEIIDL